MGGDDNVHSNESVINGTITLSPGLNLSSVEKNTFEAVEEKWVREVIRKRLFPAQKVRLVPVLGRAAVPNNHKHDLRNVNPDQHLTNRDANRMKIS